MSATQDPDPLVQALQRKTNHQQDRIEELEETVNELEATIDVLQHKLAEVEQ